MDELTIVQMIIVEDGEYTSSKLAYAVGVAVIRNFTANSDSLKDNPLFHIWENTGHRKIVRHASGAKWDKAVSSDGTVYTVHGINVFIAELCSVDNVPKNVSKTQVAGIKTIDGETTYGNGPLVITVSNILSPGKSAAAVGHIASPVASKAISDDNNDPFTVIIGTPDPNADFIVADNGHTEVEAGFITVSARIR